MKSKLLTMVSLVISLVALLPAQNAHAIFWLVGCNSTMEALYTTGRYVKQQVRYTTPTPEEAYGHMDDSNFVGCGINADGTGYYILLEDVWVEYPIENCAGGTTPTNR